MDILDTAYQDFYASGDLTKFIEMIQHGHYNNAKDYVQNTIVCSSGVANAIVIDFIFHLEDLENKI